MGEPGVESSRAPPLNDLWTSVSSAHTLLTSPPKEQSPSPSLAIGGSAWTARNLPICCPPPPQFLDGYDSGEEGHEGHTHHVHTSHLGPPGTTTVIIPGPTTPLGARTGAPANGASPSDADRAADRAAALLVANSPLGVVGSKSMPNAAAAGVGSASPSPPLSTVGLNGGGAPSLDSSSSVSSLNDSLRALPPKQPSLTSFGLNMPPLEELAKTNPNIVLLARGGCIVKTEKGGNIQFMMPPETVKDTMVLKGIEAPEHYVYPDKRFDKTNGLNLAEFEFPAYFNFFIKKRQINLICTPEGEKVIRRVFQETLFGPEEIDLDMDYASSVPLEQRADLKREMGYFRRNPFNPADLLQIETLLRFTHFNEHGVAHIRNGVSVTIMDGGTSFQINEDGRTIAKIPAWMEMNKEKSLTMEKQETVLFQPPTLGVTMLGTSHGFDPCGTTTGMVVWINGRGVIVDPPPNSNLHLRECHVPPSLIDGVILSHCHADHDAGTFQKILEEAKVMVMTTPTILGSFMRKYSAIADLPEEFLRTLFLFNPVSVGTPMRFRGGEFRFFYSLHSIPCIGFELSYNGKTIVFSGDTCNDPPRIRKMCDEGIINSYRMNELINFPWHSDLILHEAGVPPLHTPFTTFEHLPDLVKERLFLVHVAAKDVPAAMNLRGARAGVDHTMRLEVAPNQHQEAIALVDLLASIDLFRSLPLAYASALLYCAVRKEFKEGEFIVQQGEIGETFFVINSGEVALEIDGRRTERFFTVGDYFGEISIFQRTTRTASIVALTATVIYEFQGDKLLHVLQDTDVVPRLERIAHMRQEESWEVISRNTVLRKLTSGQKTQLQGLLRKVNISAGSLVWGPGQRANQAVLVSTGCLVLSTPAASAIAHRALAAPSRPLIRSVSTPLTSSLLDGLARKTPLTHPPNLASAPGTPQSNSPPEAPAHHAHSTGSTTPSNRIQAGPKRGPALQFDGTATLPTVPTPVSPNLPRAQPSGLSSPAGASGAPTPELMSAPASGSASPMSPKKTDPSIARSMQGAARRRSYGSGGSLQFKSGAIIVETDILVSGGARNTLLIASEESAVFVIDRNDLLEFMEMNPFLRIALWNESFLV